MLPLRQEPPSGSRRHGAAKVGPCWCVTNLQKRLPLEQSMLIYSYAYFHFLFHHTIIFVNTVCLLTSVFEESKTTTCEKLHFKEWPINLSTLNLFVNFELEIGKKEYVEEKTINMCSHSLTLSLFETMSLDWFGNHHFGLNWTSLMAHERKVN